jgi:hypothetical protein
MIHSTADHRAGRRIAVKDLKLIVDKRASGQQRHSKASQQHREMSPRGIQEELLQVDIAKLPAEENERFLMRLLENNFHL